MFLYLATPYSKYPHGIEAAYRLACVETARLLRAGIPVFSPIAMTHGIAVHGDIDPLDHGIWLPADEPFMQAAHGLIFLRAESWELSYGMRKEREAFEAAGKPVFDMQPGDVPASLIQYFAERTP